MEAKLHLDQRLPIVGSFDAAEGLVKAHPRELTDLRARVHLADGVSGGPGLVREPPLDQPDVSEDLLRRIWQVDQVERHRPELVNQPSQILYEYSHLLEVWRFACVSIKLRLNL